MNNSQEIILAQISAIYDKPPFVKVKTGQMEMILKCIGLGKYYDEYAKYLEPYWYNRGFQNDIESYRIFVGLNSIFEDLLNAHKGDEIISLLTELGNHMHALYAMKSNFDKVFSYNLDEVRKKNLVDMERLFNLLSVMNEQQIRLDTAVHGINSNGIERQRELNKGYLQELKAFLTDLNTLNRKNSHSDFIWKLR